MPRLHCVLLILLAGGLAAPALAIVNGERAAPDTWGAETVAFLESDFTHVKATGRFRDGEGVGSQTVHELCTGTLLGRRIVLTAVHCVDPRAVVPGGTGEKSWSAATVVSFPHLGHPEKIRVRKILRHPGFRFTYRQTKSAVLGFVENDIALVVLERDAPPGARIATPLAQEVPPRTELALRSFGFGATGIYNPRFFPGRKTPPEGMGVLRFADLAGSVSDDGSLLEFEPDRNGGKGLCEGDSGGPDLFRQDGRIYVAGVHSFQFERRSDVKNACVSRSGSVFTPYHRRWIESQLAALAESSPAPPSAPAEEDTPSAR